MFFPCALQQTLHNLRAKPLPAMAFQHGNVANLRFLEHDAKATVGNNLPIFHLGKKVRKLVAKFPLNVANSPSILAKNLLFQVDKLEHVLHCIVQFFNHVFVPFGWAKRCVFAPRGLLFVFFRLRTANVQRR